MTLLTILEVIEISCSFRLVLEGKAGKEIPEPSRLELLEKFPANNFTPSEAENDTSGPLNRGGITDLPLFRTLLAIRQKSQEPRIFVSLFNVTNVWLTIYIIFFYSTE